MMVKVKLKLYKGPESLWVKNYEVLSKDVCTTHKLYSNFQLFRVLGVAILLYTPTGAFIESFMYEDDSVKSA